MTQPHKVRNYRYMARRNYVRRTPTRRLDRLDNPKTEFSRWRALIGLLQKEAADALGVSERAVQAYEVGDNTPSYCTRIVMKMLAEKQETPRPWPK